MRVERCTLCQTELTMSNTDGGAHNPRNCAQVLYSQRNEKHDTLLSVRHIVSSWNGAHSEAVDVLTRVQHALTKTR